MSTQLDRGAVLCGPSGAVAFPHQNVQGADELKKLCVRPLNQIQLISRS